MKLELESLDLNLLTALSALLKYTSVSRAAESMNITQSGMSRSLKRLRYIFKDDLLVRVGNDMELTSTAKQLIPKLEAALSSIQQVFEQEAFHPDKLSCEFKIAAIDAFSQYLLPSFYAQLTALAPNVNLNIQNWHANTLTELAQGELDFAIGAVPTAPADVYQKLLHQSDFVCVGSKAHYSESSISLEDYLSAKHVVVHMEGKGSTPIDEKLKDINETRNVAVKVPHFNSAFELVKQTNLLFSTPRSLAKGLNASFNVHIMELPFGVTLSLIHI